MFSFEIFDIKLNTDFIGRNFIYAEEIDSTNSALLDKSNNINTNGSVFLAEMQTAGRGRKDRIWESNKEQNLTFSIMITDKALLKKSINFINFGAALAVSSAIENLYQIKTELKWPNDVLINSKKISGILLESISSGNSITKLVVGFGVNVNQSAFPGEYNIHPTSLRFEAGHEVSREGLLAEILNLFEEILIKIKENPSNILKDWKNRCRMIGEKISITEDNNVKYGIFDDLDDEGYLLLRTKDGMEKIHFGDVTIS
ncbi:MAG: biotin--[acetyl-CoA-carboxylase] ligase [Bacteroidota bacterium]|nr:biotin--[acetyl-CoA-carboxylase] ligase [Bacteroidota bacterium]